jgi:hypothetical protein
MSNYDLEYTFSTPEGHNIAHRILRPQLPHGPHNIQLAKLSIECQFEPL